MEQLTPEEQQMIEEHRASSKAGRAIFQALDAYNEARATLVSLLMTNAGSLEYRTHLRTTQVVLDQLGPDLGGHLAELDIQIGRGDEITRQT